MPIQNNPVTTDLRGSLVVPSGAEVLYLEPAIKYRLNKDSVIFSKPLNELGEVVSVKMNRHKTMAKVRMKSRITGKYFKELIPISIDETSNSSNIIANVIPKGEVVLARPFSSSNRPLQNTMHITRFSKKGDGADKTRADLSDHFTMTEDGFVVTANLKAEQSHVKFDRDIFPSEMNIDHVLQNNIGDCAVLSTVAALINSGENGITYLKDMMQQQDDGSTIVRLFDNRESPPVPVYVRVENSYYFDGLNHRAGFLNRLIGAERAKAHSVRHLAPYIHILEKAYSGFAMKQEYEKKQSALKIGVSSYLDTFQGGAYTPLVYQILTGQKTERFELDQFSKGVNPDLLKICSINTMYSEYTYEFKDKLCEAIKADLPTVRTDEYGMIDEKSSELIRTIWDKKTTEEKHSIYENKISQLYDLILDDDVFSHPCYFVFEKNFELAKKWIAYLHLMRLGSVHPYFHDENAMSFLINVQISGSSDGKQITETLKNTNNWDYPIADEITKYLPTFRGPEINAPISLYTSGSSSPIDMPTYSESGPEFSGAYSKQSVQLYNLLAEKLDTNHVIVASTHHAQKTLTPGLFSRHAYTLTEVYSKKIPHPTDPNKTVDGLFVKVRNPWGRRSLMHKMNEDSGKLEYQQILNSADSDLEINAFLRNFYSVSIGEPVLPRIEATTNNLNQPFSALANEYEKIRVIRFLKSDVAATDAYLEDNKDQLASIKEFIQTLMLEESKAILNSKIFHEENMQATIAYVNELHFLIRRIDQTQARSQLPIALNFNKHFDSPAQETNNASKHTAAKQFFIAECLQHGIYFSKLTQKNAVNSLFDRFYGILNRRYAVVSNNTTVSQMASVLKVLGAMQADIEHGGLTLTQRQLLNAEFASQKANLITSLRLHISKRQLKKLDLELEQIAYTFTEKYYHHYVNPIEADKVPTAAYAIAVKNAKELACELSQNNKMPLGEKIELLTATQLLLQSAETALSQKETSESALVAHATLANYEKLAARYKQMGTAIAVTALLLAISGALTITLAVIFPTPATPALIAAGAAALMSAAALSTFIPPNKTQNRFLGKLIKSAPFQFFKKEKIRIKMSAIKNNISKTLRVKV